MNTQKRLQSLSKSTEPQLLNVSFNQDYSCFAVCSEHGFRVFSTYPMEMKMERNFQQRKDDSKEVSKERDTGIGIIKMLYKTNYVALVGGGKNPRFPLNKLCIWDDLREKVSIVLEFNTPILNVHLSRTHIVVILKNKSLVYSFKLKPELLYSFETDNNDLGISDLSVVDSFSTFVFPGRVPGQLRIVDINNSNGNIVSSHTGDTTERDQERKSVSLIKAHKNPIRCLCLSNNGNMIASASQRGTIVRVHDTKSCSLLYEFRRGVDGADITNMKFSPDGSKLAVLSDKHTLHVYCIYDDESRDVNRTHILKNVPLFQNYFKSTWSFVSLDVGHPKDLFNDVGTLGWSDETSIIIIWKFKGIWEKFDIIMNPHFVRDDRTTHNTGKKWQIVKEGWRNVCQ